MKADHHFSFLQWTVGKYPTEITPGFPCFTFFSQFDGAYLGYELENIDREGTRIIGVKRPAPFATFGQDLIHGPLL
jgi:hypothetical protein